MEKGKTIGRTPVVTFAVEVFEKVYPGFEGLSRILEFDVKANVHTNLIAQKYVFREGLICNTDLEHALAVVARALLQVEQAFNWEVVQEIQREKGQNLTP